MPPGNRRNYYRIMHVQKDAPVEIIKSSYRTLMQKLKMHPDLGGDHWNAALINEAYAVLSDPEKREAYDLQLAEIERTTDLTVEEPPPRRQPEEEEPAPSVAPNRCAFCQTPHHHVNDISPDQLCSECGSPLCPSEPPDHDASWMRAVDRFPKDRAMAFYTRWPQAKAHTGRVQDISLTGMQFACTTRVGKHQFIKIQCDICTAIARVVYCRANPEADAGGWLVGVEFFTQRFQRSRGAFVSAHA